MWLDSKVLILGKLPWLWEYYKLCWWTSEMKQIYFTLPLIFWDYIPSTVRDKSDWHLCSPMGKGAVRNIQALRNAARVYKYSLSWFSWLQIENSVFAHVGDINQCFPGYKIQLWASVEMTSGAVTLSIIPTDFLYPDSKRKIIQRHWIQNMFTISPYLLMWKPFWCVVH